MNNINLIYFRKILDKFPDIMGGYLIFIEHSK